MVATKGDSRRPVNEPPKWKADPQAAEDLGSIVSASDEDDIEKPDDIPMRDMLRSDANQSSFCVVRERWWQIWRPRHLPPPPPKSLQDAEVIPLAHVSFLSVLTFQWVTSLMVLGYQRPLEATDLWKMDPSRESDLLSTKFLESYSERRKKAQEHNAGLQTTTPPLRLRTKWAVKSVFGRSKQSDEKPGSDRSSRESRRAALELAWRRSEGIEYPSLAWALNDVLPGFWWGGVFKVLGDTAQLMTPLVVRTLINFSKEVYAANHGTGEHPGIGRGIGMALGLWGLTVMQSVCQHQFFYRSMATGVLTRATLISAIYKKALTLSMNARVQHPNGKLMAHISSDISRVDYCAQWFHAIWTAPIQLSITLALLLVQIGPSALVGFSMFVLLGPIQTWIMRMSMTVRKKSMVWTDTRSKLLRELLSSMQIIKVFTYEIPFLKRLSFVRHKEMIGIRKINIIRAANQAMAYTVPSLASVLAFVTYAATHSDFDPALIFTSLALFNLLRQPLMFLPRALSSLADARNAIERLNEVFQAEVMQQTRTIEPDLPVALEVRQVTYQWIAQPRRETETSRKNKSDPGSRPRTSEDTLTEPFAIRNLSLTVPRGRLVAVVGPVGSGKSSMLQGLIGEMPQHSGSVEFGGNIAYCQQNAWIQNATLRENVIFGQKWDEHRYWSAIKQASLARDLEILPDGDLTEIGEKGVNLSGGQKQRVNIARALYFDANITLFDDPLSAVDAHVGRALFDEAILGLRSRGKTVVLVTHALHFLPQVDYIYALLDGAISEEGTYAQLLQDGKEFSKMVMSFGGGEAQEEEPKMHAVAPQTTKAAATLTHKSMGKAAGTGRLEGRLMTSEKRKTGSVGRKVYQSYFQAGRAPVTLPFTIAFAVIMQTSQILSTVWLTYWQERKFGQGDSLYQAVYAGLGIAQSIFTFLMGGSMGIMSYLASKRLHQSALRNVFNSPMSVFDTQPLGRLLGVFGKDIDTVDNQLADSFRMMVMTIATFLGSIIIITVFFHYFLVVILVIGIGYSYFSLFYRRSAREVKRLDSLLRGVLYAHFSESLNGLATIRAYGETQRFIKENAYYMDLEDRAYLLTTVNQRWLAIRLDFLGGCLVFSVAVMAAQGGGGLTPAQIALCLTYMATLVQLMSMVTRQSAELENNMNAVERVLWYADETSLPQEHLEDIPETTPSADWPKDGAVTFQDVVLSYRPGLPAVLKGISMQIRSGEKIGIVGRTGAGKTSITVALYRLVECSSGSIYIDDIDISKLGLRALRSKIAIIPQDPILFSGTLRSNLDPFSLHTDAQLYDALRRACVIDSSSVNGSTTSRRFTLDTPIEEEGLNLSVGERSLVSLARALVKEAQIVVLDEATSAVDLETDAKIQTTIHREFNGKTLLCIAHRLRTILSWDRVLVMDAGNIAEFDTPLNLFDKGGIFHHMCKGSDIDRADIVKANESKID